MDRTLNQEVPCTTCGAPAPRDIGPGLCDDCFAQACHELAVAISEAPTVGASTILFVDGMRRLGRGILSEKEIMADVVLADLAVEEGQE
jgi:hypothetical protein